MEQQRITCLLLSSADAGDARVVDQLRQSAMRLGIVVRDGDGEIQAGRTIAESLTRAMKDADFVVAVVSHQTSAQSWFELGLAAAVGRSLLVVLNDVQPADLPAIATFRSVGPVLTPESLDRALRRATKPRPATRGPGPVSGRSLTATSAQLLSAALANELAVTPAGGANAARFEAWFGELLSDLRVPYSTSSRAPGERSNDYENVDFAVSATELGPNIGDPMPVELVLGPAGRVLRTRSESFNRYLQATGATTLLLVTLVDEPPGLRRIANGDVLWASAADVLREVMQQTFGQSVLALRRRAVDQLGADSDG